jgi:hypothetical protein
VDIELSIAPREVRKATIKKDYNMFSDLLRYKSDFGRAKSHLEALLSLKQYKT